MSKEEIIEAIAAAKDVAHHYLSEKKRVFYRMRVQSKYGDKEYNGDNKDPEAFNQFCKDLDNESSKPTVSVITITFRDNHRDLDANLPPIVLNESLITQLDKQEQHRQEEEEEQRANSQQQQGSSLNSAMMGLFGLAFGMKGLGEANNEFGTAGVLMAAQKQTMEREFAEREQNRLIGEMKAKLQDLEKKVNELTKANNKLTLDNDKLMGQMEDYKAIKKELNEIKTKHGSIASVGSMVLAGVAEGLLAKTPFGGLLGFGQNAIPQQQELQGEEEEPQVTPETDPEAEPQPQAEDEEEEYNNNPYKMV